MQTITDSRMPVRSARRFAVFMGAMTALWSAVIAFALPAAGVPGVALGVVLIVAAMALPLRRRSLIAPRDDSPTGAVTSETRAGHSRIFGIAVMVETVGVVVVVFALGKTGNGSYILPAIAGVVALHFFVFLISQRFILHVIAGCIGTLGSLAAIALMATDVVDAPTGRAIASAALALCTLAYGIAFLSLIAQRTER